MAKITKMSFDTYKLILELSPDEAKTLFIILNKIGGDPEYSPRKYSQNILTELHKYLSNGETYHPATESENSIYFDKGADLDIYVKNK
jgi:hypothetical protein